MVGVLSAEREGAFWASVESAGGSSVARPTSSARWNGWLERSATRTSPTRSSEAWPWASGATGA